MLEILSPGVQTSVQDRGRQGLRHLGIARSGALDMPALYRANCLVGNSPEAAGLEIVLGPVSLRLLATEFGQYATASAFGSGLQYVLTLLLSGSMDYRLANIIAILAASVSNFLANDRWTFKRPKK